MNELSLKVADQQFIVRHLDKPNDTFWREFQDAKPDFVAYDTEGDGLHLKKAKSFAFAVGWHRTIYVFPTTPDTIKVLSDISKDVRRIYAHNTTFDMHMAANAADDDKFPLQIRNWGDTMGLLRLVFEAVSVRDGGDRLALKAVGDKYIDADASQYGQAVKMWLKQKVTADRKVLSALLRPHEWGLKRLEEAMNKGSEPIPDVIMGIFQEWRNAYPEPTYQDVPMDIMLPYLAVDICLTILLVEMAEPVVEHKKQVHIAKKEFRLLNTVYRMERKGIPVDREYLLDSNHKLENYIAKLQNEMHELAGEVFTVGQHATIKRIYKERFGKALTSTDKVVLAKLAREGDRFAALIRKLRTLEKWKETYCERILEVSGHDGRFYTSMNQFNPISGRFSGDAQQFPKDVLLTMEGDVLRDNGEDYSNEILFAPRRAFMGRKYFLDFSQVELRVQAHYTMPFGGDINLCRAYMPFKCVHYETGEMYDNTTASERARWNEMKPGAPIKEKHWEELLKDGWSAWVVPETGKPWEPTDVHSATTIRALRIMGYVPEEMSAKDFKWWRAKGKTFNFMRNYGGGNAKAAETLEIEFDQAVAMNSGYTSAFPLVVDYQKAVQRAMEIKGYVYNLSGRRYYITNRLNFYKAGNYLIQGSCADDLKEKMIKIDDWLIENGLETQMDLCVHDELQFVTPEGEDWVIPIIKEMMEDCPNILVPIVADVEFTDTYWSEKKDVLNLEEDRFKRH